MFKMHKRGFPLYRKAKDLVAKIFGKLFSKHFRKLFLKIHRIEKMQGKVETLKKGIPCKLVFAGEPVELKMRKGQPYIYYSDGMRLPLVEYEEDDVEVF